MIAKALDHARCRAAADVTAVRRVSDIYAKAGQGEAAHFWAQAALTAQALADLAAAYLHKVEE